MCTSDDAVATVSMTKPVRKGFLTRYKKRFLGSNWREEWIVLHEDSSLEWYKDHDESDLLGAIVLKEAPEMIAAGPFALYVPGRPDLPKNTDPNNIMVFGNKTKDKMHWFICKNMDELNQWMTVISNTLPPPPDPPKPPENGDKDQPPPYTPTPSAPAAQPAQPYNPPAVGQGGGGGGVVGGGYPRGGGRGYGGGGRGYGGGGYGGGPGGYGGGPVGYGGGGQNTVIVDRRDNGIGDFATGMMMGSALSGWGPGFGWGFGLGFGVPVYGGFGGFRGGGFHNQETNITNNYNTTNNTTNNAADPAAGGGDPEGADPTDAGGLEPDAEVLPGDGVNGVDPGLMEDGGGMGMHDGIDPGLLDEGGMDMAAMEDMGGGGFEMGGMDDMGGYDMGGGFDMDMGGFDMGGFDMGF